MVKKFNKLKKWVEKNGYTVEMSNSDEVHYYEKKVLLCKNQPGINLIYSFLHECGHVVLYKKKSYDVDYKILNSANEDGRHLKGNLFKYKQLKEEIQAWESGYKLSKKLKINIDKDAYDKYAAKYFMTYIKNK